MIRQSNAYELNSISRSHLQITNQPHTVTRSLTDLNLKTHEQFISRSCFEFHKKIRLHIQPTQSFPIIRLPERQQITKGEHSVTWGTPLKMRSIVLWGCVVEQSWAASTFWKNMFRVFIPWRWRRYVPRKIDKHLQNYTKETTRFIFTAVRTADVTRSEICKA